MKQNETMAAAVAPFKTWKESLGHTVYVATLDWVNANYSGVDVAEKVWNFLHTEYPVSKWGIRYVLLVGDLRIVPRRLLFYSNPLKEWGLQSDHFYAKSSGGDTSAQVWNHDGDRRWGEVDGDEMSVVTAWNGSAHGMSIFADHGNWDGLSGHIWQHDTLTTTSQVDKGEWAWSDLFKIGIPWAFTLFGDPSMVLEGYDTSAQGTNRTIHTGAVYAYGTDNADDGDMYVAVSTRPDTEDGEVKVYKQVKVARSTSNGSTWTDRFTYEGYQQPHIDAGLAGSSNHVYLTAVADSFPNDVHVKRSTDRGASWGSWMNLTSGDGADYHGAPVVAASTDAAAPTVWVAYGYYKPVVLGGADLRFAYSTNGGGNWTQNRILSAEQGFDELMPDMAGYRAGPSKWMNIAYNHDQSARTNVVWRWVNGSTPGNWSAPRPVNDHDTHPAADPQVIYSPGVTATGSGVVYAGSGSVLTNLYFAAPWLTATTGNAMLAWGPYSGTVGDRPQRYEEGDHPQRREEDALAQAAAPAEFVRPQAPDQAELSYWAFTGQVGQAFRVAGLVRHPDGTLYAAATTSAVDSANTGTVFRSDDGGATWEPVPELPLAWWLDSILVTDAGTLLVGGTLYDFHNPDAHAHGSIYRSDDRGEHWSIVAERLDTGSVLALLQRANGDIVAGAGPGGITLVSPDDGVTWQPLGTPPGARHVHALLETAEGRLYAGGARTDGTGAIYRFVGGEEWETVKVLDNPAAVYALLEDASQVLYAGVAFADHTGRVFRSFDGGQNWEPSAPLGESQAVRTLLEGPEGRLYAGVDVGPGTFTSYVYASADGGETWQDGGFLYMADAAYDLLLTSEGAIYAASGDTYGVIFRTGSSGVGGHRVYLPCVSIPYPGRLADEAGQAVADGAYDFAFALYDAYGGFFSSDSDDFDLALGGRRGRINSDPTDQDSNLYLSSNADVTIKLDNDGGEDHFLRILNSAGANVCTVSENTTVGLVCTNKSAVVGTANYGSRLLYVVESPEVWFEDLGTAALVDGQATVVVEKGEASGGRYHLTSVSWYVSGTASGGGYRLLSPSSPTLRGNGCCCTYLPCVLRNRQ